MRRINYSLQYPNYDHKDCGEISEEEAVKFVQNFEWDKFIEEYKKITESGTEACPPNVSFTDSKLNFMVWANPDSKYGIMASIPTQKKIMLMKFESQKTLEYDKVSENDMLELLRAYFNANYEVIKNYK